jgi:hypothetical protein
MPCFLFKLSGKDINGNSVARTQIAAFSEKYVKENCKDDGTVTMDIFFSDLIAGEYTCEEIDVIRYGLSKIESISDNGGSPPLPLRFYILIYNPLFL